MDVKKFRRHHRHKPGISDCGSDGTFSGAAVKRTRRMNVADAAAQNVSFVNGNEYSACLSQCAGSDLRQPRRLAREIGADGISGDFQKKLLIFLNELEHREWGHDGVAFFPTESGDGARAP